MTTTTDATKVTRPKFILKACPRCRGDLKFRSDYFGDYYDCLQCGAELEPPVTGMSELKETRQAA
ncbi:MAG: hypothetical protein IH957_13165 [Chloroflexi bacterium]|nr:hypothetical protein [Chloroflexota bacterium]